MSYEPAALGFTLPGGTKRRRFKRRRPSQAFRPRARRAARPGANYGPTLASPRYLADLPDDGGGLGLSLRPSKRLRKIGRAIKKNVTLKRALVAGAIVGAAFIPGVGPAMLAAAKTAGHGIAVAARGVGRGIRAVEKEIVGGFTGKLGKKKPKPSDTPYGPPYPGPPESPSAGGGGGGPTYGPPAPPPDYSAPSPDYGGGGGSAGGGPSDYSSAPGPAATPVPTDDEDVTAEAETPAPAQSSALPMVLGLGVVALLAKANKRRRAA